MEKTVIENNESEITISSILAPKKKKTQKVVPPDKFGFIVEEVKDLNFPYLQDTEQWFQSTFYYYYRITLVNNTSKPIENINGKIACNCLACL